MGIWEEKKSHKARTRAHVTHMDSRCATLQRHTSISLPEQVQQTKQPAWERYNKIPTRACLIGRGEEDREGGLDEQALQCSIPTSCSEVMQSPENEPNGHTLFIHQLISTQAGIALGSSLPCQVYFLYLTYMVGFIDIESDGILLGVFMLHVAFVVENTNRFVYVVLMVERCAGQSLPLPGSSWK